MNIKVREQFDAFNSLMTEQGDALQRRTQGQIDRLVARLGEQ